MRISTGSSSMGKPGIDREVFDLLPDYQRKHAKRLRAMGQVGVYLERMVASPAGSFAIYFNDAVNVRAGDFFAPYAESLCIVRGRTSGEEIIADSSSPWLILSTGFRQPYTMMDVRDGKLSVDYHDQQKLVVDIITNTVQEIQIVRDEKTDIYLLSK
jgi:hypothetical protein